MGKIENNNFEPSRGGIGNILKTSKTMLIRATKLKKSNQMELELYKTIISKPETIIITRLAKGPATPTMAEPHL